MSDNYAPQVGDKVAVSIPTADVTAVKPEAGGYTVLLKIGDTNEEREFFTFDGTYGSVHLRLLHRAAPATLPTTPGSIVHYKHDATELYVRVDGGWYDIDEKCVTERTLGPNLYEVVFDAGADR